MAEKEVFSDPVNEEASDSTRSDVCRVGIRAPPFYPERPSLWFTQLESQFVLNGVKKDCTKFHYALSQLEPVYAAEVEDIITLPITAGDKYVRLKTELVKRLSASREKKVKQLLTFEELGDRKPSQFLRHLNQLAGPGVPEEFIRTIWTSRLPSSTQSIIAAQSKITLEEVAELADRIHDVVTPGLQVASVSAGYSQIAELTKQVEMLAQKVERMSRPSERRTSFSRSRARSTSTRSQSSYKKCPTCWYHSKFGDNARRCVKPCDWKATGKAQGNP